MTQRLRIDAGAATLVASGRGHRQSLAVGRVGKKAALYFLSSVPRCSLSLTRCQWARRTEPEPLQPGQDRGGEIG